MTTLKRFTLSKIYRQEDKIDGLILSRIRVGSQTDLDLAALNRNVTDKCHPRATVLTPYRAQMHRVNDQMLARLDTEELVFECKRTGTFKKYAKESIFPDVLRLKRGCRVVIKANDKRKVKGVTQTLINGQAGTFWEIDKHNRLVIERDDGMEVYVKPKKVLKTKPEIHTEVDERGVKKEHIKDKTTGSFVQYPVQLGYCMTTHSSQGSTLERVHLMLGNGKPFAPGLLYVALSRVKSLKNLTLSRPLLHSDNLVQERIQKPLEEQGEL